MSPDVIAGVERALVFPGAMVALRCDQYRVELRLVRDKMQLIIMVYVDGWMRGTWLLNDCEERRRFMRPVHVTRRWSPSLKRALGKKWVKEHSRGRTYYVPYWKSIKPMLRHFQKHNASIELFNQATEVAS